MKKFKNIRTEELIEELKNRYIEEVGETGEHTYYEDILDIIESDIVGFMTEEMIEEVASTHGLIVDDYGIEGVLGKGFIAALEENIEKIVEGHLEIYMEEYYRKCGELVASYLEDGNYDFTIEIDMIKNKIKRELTETEKDYFIERFIKQVKEQY